MTTESAALPWGIPSKPVDPSLIKNVPENMKLDIGTARIEVKWILSSEEDDDGASDSFVTKVSTIHSRSFQNNSNYGLSG